MLIENLNTDDKIIICSKKNTLKIAEPTLKKKPILIDLTLPKKEMFDITEEMKTDGISANAE